MDELLQAHTENNEETSLYEVGYHLVPTLAVEALSAEVAKIKEFIIARQGVIISEGMPQKMSLAYKLPRVIENVRAFFDSSYFGWLRFEVLPQEIASIEHFLKGNASVIRFIVFRAQPEKIHVATRKMPFIGAQKFSMKEEGRVADKKLETEKTEPHKTFSETEMDKTIEELINE